VKAAWYTRNGRADDVLEVGDMADPLPGPNAVRVRIQRAGINPHDVKRRSGTGGRSMGAPVIVPGDDGAGVIDMVGAGVDDRVGQRVWVHSACHSSPFGTSAELTVVPSTNAIELPLATSFDTGACIGVPALTAHRCLFADGPVRGSTVLVTGGAGAVGHHAIEMAVHGGATVIATASTPEKQRAALDAGAHHVVDYRRDDAATHILELTEGRGVDRIVEVALGANMALTTAVIALDGVISTYASEAVPEPLIPVYALMRRGVTIRIILVFVMPLAALASAITDVTTLLESRALSHQIAAIYPLESIAAAHIEVEQRERIGKVLLDTASGSMPDLETREASR
jgi:NADPH2:quinone reductase